ncbi:MULTISPECIES: TM2 domain-containing protein [Shewanella]|jgi:TM2 domain-containing membrane protein YozV|uniref:TM2 domain-containing protein n=1 Tax=Shewanella TaxID=22 RepID=UPI000F6EC530|nr:MULTISPECIES: TM2 domain-containing protein [Shewanella]MCS6096430.1 TM2 domain-containing protein [Shewanella baltica]MCS6120791.1 TM2 domain-containing protein [Shewanella baltica]MCS6192772.1 TM2 domain-containing protein [Shewanella baltica]MCS6227538.1 TM2 domain-containing protein [Shewanella baltica]MCS6231039.1 TM2 domain-containing protein [Shewanella baltica]
MKGKILEFNESERSGIISGEDGNRYELNISEWKGASLPRSGTKVDFSINGQTAEAVYAENHGSAGASKKIAAALFAFFLGAFGAHKFYLGYTKQGVIMLLVFLFGFILLGLPSMVIGIIAFVEFILYLVKSDEEFEQTYVIGQKPWF